MRVYLTIKFCKQYRLRLNDVLWCSVGQETRTCTTRGSTVPVGNRGTGGTGTVDPRALGVFIHTNTLPVMTTFDVSWLANS